VWAEVCHLKSQQSPLKSSILHMRVLPKSQYNPVEMSRMKQINYLKKRKKKKTLCKRVPRWSLTVLLGSSLEEYEFPSITACTIWHIGSKVMVQLGRRKTKCLFPRSQVLACFIVTSHIFSDIPLPKICSSNRNEVNF
jgi:hypothetical protein